MSINLRRRIALLGAAVFAACGATACHSKLDVAARLPPPGMDAAAGPVFDAGGFSVPDAPEAGGYVAPTTTTTDIDCATAAGLHANAGCSFYPLALTPAVDGACFAAVVVNPGAHPARITLDRGGTSLALRNAVRQPRGSGQSITYQALAEDGVIPPGEVALVFLSQSSTQVFARCPSLAIPAITGVTHLDLGLDSDQPLSGLGQAFHLASDRPVVAYAIFPYGGGTSAFPWATLLLPQESWGTGYVAAHPIQNGGMQPTPRSVGIVAAQDDTQVKIRPTVDLPASADVPALPKDVVTTITLKAGQYLELAHPTAELTGSLISSDKPIGVYGGTPCFYTPADSLACDGAQQQIPPASALGHEYVAVRYKSRSATQEETVPWRLVGVVDGTTLSYEPAAPPGAPTTLARGQFAELSTNAPFVVHSQDADHPFYMAGYMTAGSLFDGAGDPEFVNVQPTSQYLPSYVFFTDPTYPETSLVVVRQPGKDGKFADVKLGCSATPIGGWKPIGAYQYTRVDLVTGNWQPVIPGCDNGRQQMDSAAPFAVTVWGWGTLATGQGTPAGSPPFQALPPWYTRYASYAYPAGGGVAKVNQVVIIE